MHKALGFAAHRLYTVFRRKIKNVPGTGPGTF